MRGSSVNFKKVTSALHSVSHANRDVPPDYLLPEGMSLGTHIVIDDQGEVQKTLTHKMSLASGRAKASPDYSPIWEGVINLPTPSKDITAEHQIEIVKAWCFEYEKLTGHKVLRADVHLDEGYIDAAGVPQFNAHAHVMADRTNDKGRVIKLSPAQLRAVQTMTAEVTSLERGLDARQTGRKHIGHQNFKFIAEKNRVGLDVEKRKTARLQKLFSADTQVIDGLKEQVAQQAQQIARLHEQYRLDREAMKASGEAKQKDYQALKKEHEAALAKLATVQAVADQVPALEAKVAEGAKVWESVRPTIEKLTQKVETMTQANQDLQAQLDAKTELDAARFAAMGTGYQADVAAGLDPFLAVPGQPAPPKATKQPLEAPKPKTQPTPSPTPKKQALEAPKPVEPVFPRLTEPEFEKLAVKVTMSDRIGDAAKDVLVWGVGLVEAARKQHIFPAALTRALAKLLGNYIAPSPPSIQPDPAKPVPPGPKAPGRGPGR